MNGTGNLFDMEKDCILGVDIGKKDVLGLYSAENEDARFWLGVLTDLKKCSCSRRIKKHI